MIQFKGGSGSSEQEAVIIRGAESELEGVDAEYDYLDNLLGDLRLMEQSVILKDEKVYYVLVIENKNKLHTLWFDITSMW